MSRRLLAIILVLATLSACTGASQSPSVGASRFAFPTDDDFAETVLELTGRDDPEGGQLHAFWQSVLEGLPLDRAYEPPVRVSSYASGEQPDAPCGTTRAADFWRNGATYCPSDRQIVFDETWLRDFQEDVGDFAPAAILAHEWGHHIQESFGSLQYDIHYELQADCFAGMFLAATEQREPGLYVVGGDLAASLEAIFAKADRDYKDDDYWAAGTHGTGQQRIMAMGTGYLPISSTASENPLSASSGLPWCYGYGEYGPDDRAQIGPYSLVNLPGRTEEWLGETYGIAADERSGVATSDIALFWIASLPRAGEGATDAQIEALWDVGFPGMSKIFDVPMQPPTSGTHAARYFENHFTQTDGTEATQSGIFALISPADGAGALLVMVSRGQPAPAADSTDPADFILIQEQLASVYQVVNRLCGPDDSGNIADPNLNVACMGVQ